MLVGNENSEQRALRRMRNAERDRQDEQCLGQRQLHGAYSPKAAAQKSRRDIAAVRKSLARLRKDLWGDVDCFLESRTSEIADRIERQLAVLEDEINEMVPPPKTRRRT